MKPKTAEEWHKYLDPCEHIDTFIEMVQRNAIEAVIETANEKFAELKQSYKSPTDTEVYCLLSIDSFLLQLSNHEDLKI